VLVEQEQAPVWLLPESVALLALAGPESVAPCERRAAQPDDWAAHHVQRARARSALRVEPEAAAVYGPQAALQDGWAEAAEYERRAALPDGWAEPRELPVAVLAALRAEPEEAAAYVQPVALPDGWVEAAEYEQPAALQDGWAAHRAQRVAELAHLDAPRGRVLRDVRAGRPAPHVRVEEPFRGGQRPPGYQLWLPDARPSA
jgi:hypothetical protein